MGRLREYTGETLIIHRPSFGRGAIVLFCLYPFLADPSLIQAQSAIPQEEESVDWPSVISQLRQEMYQRSGHAQTRQHLATAYNNYGVSLGEQGQWQLAVQQLEEAMHLDETNPQFALNLSRIHLNQAHEAYLHRQPQEAKRFLESAIRLEPKLAQAYALLGKIEYETQRLTEAKNAWQRAMDLDPKAPGVAEQLARVTEELPLESEFDRLSQAYFDIRYEEDIPHPSGFDIRDALLDARREVGRDFAHWPKYKIVVLVYSAQSFRTLRTELPEWVAGTYDGKIRVSLPGSELSPQVARRIVFHEYTHALVHELTQGECPHWLNEGLAEYEGNRQAPQAFERLKQTHENDSVIAWEQLDALFMSQMRDQVELAYQQAHSVVQYLVQRYGFWRIRRILKELASGKRLEEIIPRECHVKIASLEQSWRRWLSQFLNPV